MADNQAIQAYQELQPSIIDAQCVARLDQRLDPRLIKQRRSGGGMVKFVQGHSAIDQANRIFGYGNWGWRTVSVEQVVLEDPIAHEAVGIEYRAVVEVTVRGCLPISDVGSQPVSTWNVEDQIMQRRLKVASYNKTKVDEGPFTPIERREARAVIVDAHEAAKKGAVTDALKRALRGYGNQFGNELYGDGHVDVSDAEPGRVTVSAEPATNASTSNHRQIAAPARVVESKTAEIPAMSDEQRNKISALRKQLGQEDKGRDLNINQANNLIANLERMVAAKAKENKPATPPQAKPTEQQMSVKLQALGKVADRCNEAFGADKGPSVYQRIRTHVVKTLNLGDIPDELMPDEALSQMWNTLNTSINKQPVTAGK